MAANPYCLIGGLPMNNKPIAQSRDADLRNSQIALLRAAARARELARRTGTRLVVQYGGKLCYIAAGSPVAGEERGSYRKDA